MGASLQIVGKGFFANAARFRHGIQLQEQKKLGSPFSRIPLWGATFFSNLSKLFF
jgi:hypothetical protein